MGEESPKPSSTPKGAVFLSYASQDAQAAQKICDALSAAGIEVWFDKSELRGGDVWDRRIREQIHSCRLFIPIISANTESRDEGYFRREWGFATDRTRDIAEKRAFLIPVVIDDTPERGSSVPDKFHQIQWTRLPRGETPPAFVARVAALLGAPKSVATGNRPTPALTTAPPAHTRSQRNVWIILGLAALGIVLGGGWFALRQSGLHRHAQAETADQASPAITEKSIAVLPFDDLSEKHDQEYFADGMAEEVINLLAKIPDLKVIGRISSFQFKGKTDDVRRIGMTLGAAYIVEGSVRRSGDHVRVTAQLIDTRDGVQRWSETYDRQASDVLQVQDAIAASLVRALQVEVAESGRLQTRPVLTSRESYDAYLRGIHAFEKRDPSGFEEAIARFRRALELDPSYVPAAEALAIAYRNQAYFGFVPPKVGYEQARMAAGAVLKLNQGSAIAHAVLLAVHTEYDWDWVSAERELDTAMSLAPNNATVLLYASEERLAVGQLNEAMRYLESAGTVDPLYTEVYFDLSLVYLRLSRYEESARALRRIAEISPTAEWVHYYLCVVLLVQGDPNAALREMEKETVPSIRLAGLALAYYALKRTTEANNSLAQLEARNGGDSAMTIAEAYAYREQNDLAMKWLDRAYAQKDINLWYIKGDPLLAKLEGDPRYKAFLRKMNLPE
jgi:TolB-like protein/Tfp pilus assembly protein PilF